MYRGIDPRNTNILQSQQVLLIKWVQISTHKEIKQILVKCWADSMLIVGSHINNEATSIRSLVDEHVPGYIYILHLEPWKGDQTLVPLAQNIEAQY